MPMNNPRKSKEQRSWELRKMQMAGIKVDPSEIKDVDNSSVDLTYKTSLFLNHKYYKSEIGDVLKTNSEMFQIGNKESLYFEKFKESGDFVNSEVNFQRFNFRDNSRSFKSPRHKEIKDLPVFKHKEDFFDFYRRNSVMVVTGETGCGKSTLVPKLIFDRFSHRIAITQPRRISVKSLYRRMRMFYGKEVGYSIRFENYSGKDTRIKFMTEGILLKEIQEDNLLEKYDVVILDEAHERSVSLDILMGFLKKIHTKRPSLKIIIMSATLNVSKFTSFFNCNSFTFDGKRFPVEIKYLEVDVDDYIEWTVKKTVNIVYNMIGDVLVFLSGKDDIDKAFSLICHAVKDYKDPLTVIKCNSENLNEVYPLIFQDNKYSRKVILSTNVAEASVTIPNITYIVDSGFHKILVHDYSQGDVLVRCPISKESAIQRAGRCGRTSPGVCFRMYTKQTYENCFDDFTIPEILRSNISSILLLLASINISDIFSLPLIDMPAQQLVSSCYDFLILLEALDESRCITKLGRSIVEWGIDCITGKMIYEGILKGCSYEMVLLVSILSCDTSKIMNILKQIRERQSDFYNLTCQNNDFITLINIFKDKRHKDTSLVDHKLRDSCNFIFERLSSRIRQDLKSGTSPEILKKVFLRAFFFNISRSSGKEFQNIISRSTFYLPKNTTVEEDVEYVTYFRTFKSKERNFAYLCMKVDPLDVLKEVGDIFENKKEVKYTAKSNIKEIVIDQTNLYDNFELEEEEEENVKKVKKRRVLL